MTTLRKHVTEKTRPTNASKEWVRTYNALQDRINSFILAGHPIPTELLNASFAMVESCYPQGISQ